MSTERSAPAGPVVIVTGAGGPGIGSTVARTLAADGYQVAVTDVSEESAHLVADELRAAGLAARAYQLDVSDPAQVEVVVQLITSDLGQPEALVNSAGRGLIGPVADTAVADWDALHQVDLRGAFLMIKTCLPLMVAQGRGSIVNIGSVQAARPSAGYSAYAAAKAGLTSLSRSVAAEYGRHGVRCNVVHPGLVDTPANRELMSALGDPEQLIHAFTEGSQMLHHSVTADDIAAGVRFLLSEQARSITAAELTIDAGYSQLTRPLI
jgi:NAD(P)-dependent dehydrogenase (short-subunit alcohol dehydrogenase family)